MCKAANSGCGWFLLLLFSTTLVVKAGSCPIITQEPSGVLASSCDFATLQVQATGTPPLRYQWYRENNPIPDATNAIYTTPRPVSFYEGRYFVTVQNEGCLAITSRVADVIVVGDLVRPGVLRATALNSTQILIAFYGCPLDPLSALEPSNYQISGGINVSNVAVLEETNVLLTTSTMAPSTHYVLHMEYISDIMANVIEPADVSLWTPPLRLFLTRSNNIADLTWPAGGILQRSVNATGQWLDATGPTNRARLSNDAGFYRVRFP